MNLIFKLSTGEIIIGNVTGNTTTSYELSYPALLAQHGLEPYMGFGLGKITLYTSNIVATTEPDPNINISYNDMFGPKSTLDIGCTKG